jgi:hypothetical protein
MLEELIENHPVATIIGLAVIYILIIIFAAGV